jgi:hypothetical protein
LEPLNRRYPDHPYQKEVAAFKQKLDAAEADTPGEAQRFFERGQKLEREGDSAGARRLWQATITVFKDVESEKRWVERAQRALTDLEKSGTAPDRWQSVKLALERAAKLRDAGKRAEAEKIWIGIEELYRDDPWAKGVLEQVSDARKQGPGK